MEEFKKFFEHSGIIALRKTEFFEKVWSQFSMQIPEHINKNEVKNLLLDIISNLDNKFFISDLEKKNKTIDPKLPLEKLKLDNNAIWGKVEKLLAELQ